MQQQGSESLLWLTHSWRNSLQSLLLLALMAGFLALLGYLLWGIEGILILLWVCGFSVLLIPVYSPWLLLKMYAASPIAPHQSPTLWAIVSELAERAHLTTIPCLYYIPSRLPNAFTMGSKKHAMIAISDGLLRRLSPPELSAIIAHEISHISHNDLWILGLADLISRTTTLLSLLGQLFLLLTLPLLLLTDLAINWLAILLLITAPLISTLAQQALSRTREFEADLGAAKLTGDPERLAVALAKLDSPDPSGRLQTLISGQSSPGPSSLRSHPPTEARIARLMRLQSTLMPLDRRTLKRDSERNPGIPEGRSVDQSPRWHLNGLWY